MTVKISPKYIVTTLLALILLSITGFTQTAQGSKFQSAWQKGVERVWIGPEYWANRLQDWRIANGRLECVEGQFIKPMRTVHLLTRRLNSQECEFAVSVRTGLIDMAEEEVPNAAAGFLIGAGGELEYRAAALIHHSAGLGGGVLALMEGTGRAVFRDMSADDCEILAAAKYTTELLPDEVQLRLTGRPVGSEYKLTLEVCNIRTGMIISHVTLNNVSPDRLTGNVALVSHPGNDKGNNEDNMGDCWWFRDWEVSGSKVSVYKYRVCGPIISTQYTLSRDILKMTAQMMPIAKNDLQMVILQINQDGKWKTVGKEKIIVPAYTVTFRIENWDSGKDTPYRVAYDLKKADGTIKTYTWYGTVRKDPVDKPAIIVAGFTGNHNVAHPGVERGIPWTKAGIWFPHNDIVNNIKKHKPDLLFFSGDQVYEGNSPTKPVKKPYDKAVLDYLYKWYLWCWAFRDLAKDIPCVCIPDDHDVYHGNIWGAGGRHAEHPDDGGYTMPVNFVKMVERTQTSHLPDPFDPTPVEQGIGVYYCAMNCGGISFAIIEDRKFKSSPTVLIPEGKVVNGWFHNPDFDPVKQADVLGAKLLGARQLYFLHKWSTDWSGGAVMKAVLSQSVFSNVATLPKPADSDKVVPQLRLLLPNEYPEDDMRVSDADSHGWPQSGRNKALREMRRGFAFHLCGDQHLASMIQYGVDDWHDAGFALCVPSIANFWPRRWFPSTPGLNRQPGEPLYTGDFKDGFGNFMTVYAVSNPIISGRQPSILHDRAPGYGIVKFNKPDRTITIECWPRYADPCDPGSGGQYPGWPKTIHAEDNYDQKAAAYLPEIKVTGMSDPVIQIIDELDGEIVYTLRIKGASFRPKVFRKGIYTVKVGDPDTGQMKTLNNLQSIQESESQTIKITF